MRSLGTIGRALATACALLAAPITACGDDGDKTDTTNTTDTSVTPDTNDTSVTPDTTETDTAVPADTTPDVPDEITGPVTWDQVYDIFHRDCVPCHATTTATSGSGGHSIGSAEPDVAYDASQLPVSENAPAACAGKKKGECALIRIKDGSMPASGDCADDPPGAKCPTAEEQALIQQWIDDGMLEE